jgi:hypothetical protein
MEIKTWQRHNWDKLCCYFCEISGDFERTKFVYHGICEVTCPKCKHLIPELGGRIVEEV